MTSRIITLGLPLVLTALCIPAAAGTARTMEGRTFHGQLRLDSRGFFMLTQYRGPQVRVNLPSLLYGQFTGDPEAGTLHRGVVLRDGRAIAAEAIESGPGRSIRARQEKRGVTTVELESVSELVFAPAAPRRAATSPGVFLQNGDFVDGRFRSLENNRLRINSILFGPMSFDTRTEVSRMVLVTAVAGQKVGGPADADYLVRLRDGTSLRARQVQLQGANLIVDDAVLGRFTLAGEELLSIRYVGERVTPLATLPPQEMRGQMALLVGAASATIRGDRPETAIRMAGGAEAIWRIEEKPAVLICRVGVPERSLPAGRVRFVVSAGDRDVFTSPSVNSIDDPIDVVVPLAAGQTVRLRVEADGDFSPAGLWADPLLLRD